MTKAKHIVFCLDEAVKSKYKQEIYDQAIELLATMNAHCNFSLFLTSLDGIIITISVTFNGLTPDSPDSWDADTQISVRILYYTFYVNKKTNFRWNMMVFVAS